MAESVHKADQWSAPRQVHATDQAHTLGAAGPWARHELFCGICRLPAGCLRACPAARRELSCTNTARARTRLYCLHLREVIACSCCKALRPHASRGRDDGDRAAVVRQTGRGRS